MRKQMTILGVSLALAGVHIVKALGPEERVGVDWRGTGDDGALVVKGDTPRHFLRMAGLQALCGEAILSIMFTG